MIRRFAHDEIAAAKVRRDNFVEIFDVALPDWGEHHDTCAVHDNSDFPKRGLRLLKKLRDLGHLGNICANRNCGTAGGLDALDCFLCLRRVSSIMRDNCKAVLGQTFCDALADAA